MNCEILELSDVADIFNGKTPSKAEQRSSGFPVLKIRDVDDTGNFVGRFSSFVEPAIAAKHPTKQVKFGDTLILNAAHNADYVGSKTFFATELVQGALATGEWLVVRPDEKAVNHEYVYYWSQTAEAKRRIRDAVKGIHLYPKDVGAFPIQIPAQPEQERIATILSKADRLRRTRRYVHQLSDTFLQSAFVEMFGDPASNPKGWSIGYLGEVMTSAKDGPHVSPNYEKDGIPFLSTRNIRPGEVIWDDLKFISRKDAEKQWEKVKPEKGDILYTKGGTTGIAKAVDFDRDVAVWVHIAVLKINNDMADPMWLETMLNSDFCYRQSQTLTFGIVNRDLGLKRIPRIRLYIPSLPNQQKFAAIVRRFKRLRAQQREAERQAEHLFQTLLHRAFAP